MLVNVNRSSTAWRKRVASSTKSTKSGGTVETSMSSNTCGNRSAHMCSDMGGSRLGQASIIWTRWSQLEAPHGVVTQPESPISRWMAPSVIGLSPR